MAGIRIQSVKKRGFLRQIVEGARSASLTLKAALLNAQSSVFSPTFKTGRIVISQSGAGQSGSFLMPGDTVEWSQDNVFGLIEELLELHDTVVAGGTSADDLDALFNAMCADDSMIGVRSSMGDFTTLRFPVTR